MATGSEVIVGSWVAGVPFKPGGRLSRHGGTLVLTSERLVFRPLEFGTPVVTNPDPGQPFSYPLEEIERVVAAGERPARLRVKLRSGESQDFMVSQKRLVSIWNRDTTARDELLRVLQGATGRA